ncbi:MAG TPA: HAD-IC family P-type ATPase, partial [Pyrinomonadaceae bacterium]|nr:HAD-IC family P-type ATPase [Pyrinomonadaceae bacterium]
MSNKNNGINNSNNVLRKEDSLHSLSAAPYSYSVDKITDFLKVDPSKGLSNNEALARQLRDGTNTIATSKGPAWWQIFLRQFASIVIWLLAFAAVVAWFTESRLEAVAILTVLVLNALIGFAIEWQAGRALDALRKATHTFARVRREGGERIVDSSDLVSGDIVVLTAGDCVPADSLLVETANLYTDESSLTGESLPVAKMSGAVSASAPLAERRSMLYLGSNIVRGRALGVVTATGEKTEIGRIGRLLNETSPGKTPLELKLQVMGKWLVYIVVVVAVATMIAGYLRGDDLWLMFEVAISLAVAAVPEGLPAVTTLILALGVMRMARRNAIVRKLSAVETLGSTSVICTDKTGTLTENRLTVQEFQLSDGEVIKLSDSQLTASPNDAFLRLLRVSVLCNEASFDPDLEKDKRAIGDPTETALLIAADKYGLNAPAERSKYKKIFEHPFDASTKRMITVSESGDAKQFAGMKGAPAVVLDICSHFITTAGSIRILDEGFRREFLK